MAIIYRTNGPWGAGKGAKLTPVEVDGNFFDLHTRLATIEGAAAPVPITDITVDGGLMTITVQGGEEFLIPLPVLTFTPRGTWAHPNHYNFLDIVTVAALGGYLVVQGHDTETPFDPLRLISGNPVYQKLFDAGATGAAGPAGPAGSPGAPGADGFFSIEAQDVFANRDAFDNEDPGFTFVSTDGADGLGGLDVLYIMGEGGPGDWTGPFAWQGPAGATGATGATGPAGANGLNFNVDEVGLFADRDDFDAEAEGFSYLSTNGDAGATTSTAVIYFRETATPGVWSVAVPFQGPVGPQGPTGLTGAAGATGPQGPKGDNFDPDAIGTFAGRAAFNAQAAGFSYLSTNGDGAGFPDASIYIKNSATSGDWGPRIPFAGPKGNTGPVGPAGAPGPAGPAGANGSNGVGVASGGATGQGLVKTSGADFATDWAWPIETLIVPLGDETTNITTGAAKVTMRMPYKGQFVGLPRASLATASTSGAPQFDINRGDGNSILSTKLTIDANEKTSVAAVTPAVVSDSTFDDDEEYTFDIDTAGTGAKGAKILCYIQRVP